MRSYILKNGNVVQGKKKLYRETAEYSNKLMLEQNHKNLLFTLGFFVVKIGI